MNVVLLVSGRTETSISITIEDVIMKGQETLKYFNRNIRLEHHTREAVETPTRPLKKSVA